MDIKKDPSILAHVRFIGNNTTNVKDDYYHFLKTFEVLGNVPSQDLKKYDLISIEYIPPMENDLIVCTDKEKPIYLAKANDQNKHLSLGVVKAKTRLFIDRNKEGGANSEESGGAAQKGTIKEKGF